MESGSVNQSVTALWPGALDRLLTGEAYSLGDWYATPLPPAVADALLETTRMAHRVRLCTGGSCAPLQVLAEICRFWLDAATDGPGQEADAEPRHAALRELVRGQLLTSRKLLPAPACLERGFRLAAPFLETADYFRLLREHELLACLPFSDRPALALDLPALLNEAAVIRHLRRGDRRRPIWPHLDTLG